MRTASIAQSKAWTSRAFDISTHDLASNAQPGRQFYGIHTTNGGEVAIFAGGVPLERDGAIVGAIGVSGGTGDLDICQHKAPPDAQSLTA